MKHKASKFDDIAERVLSSQYGFENPHIAFVRHSDNITYKVTTADSKSYLFRIHIPITTAMGSHGADYEMVNSEVTWMLAVAQNTNLTIQEPIKNKSGTLVTQIQNSDHSTINASLLSWIEGEPYHRDLESEGTAYQIGGLLATLHNQASQWEIPKGFIRPKRDIEYFEQMLRSIKPAVSDGQISKSDYAELSTSVSLLVDMLSSLDESQQYCGIMHADTHKGNMLLHHGEIRLIDYSFCALGNYMFDLGVCFGDMKPELHRSCIQGYQSLRKLPEDYHHLIEGLFLGRIIGTFSFWAANPNAQELLAKKVPQITKDFATRFNRNEYFWF